MSAFLRQIQANTRLNTNTWESIEIQGIKKHLITVSRESVSTFLHHACMRTITDNNVEELARMIHLDPDFDGFKMTFHPANSNGVVYVTIRWSEDQAEPKDKAAE